MLTSEARALVTEIQDRLIDLYVQQDEARGEHDPDRARELQVEIDKATAQREEIRRWSVQAVRGRLPSFAVKQHASFCLGSRTPSGLPSERSRPASGARRLATVSWSGRTFRRCSNRRTSGDAPSISLTSPIMLATRRSCPVRTRKPCRDWWRHCSLLCNVTPPT